MQAGNELGYGPPSMPSPQYSTPSDRPAKAPVNIRGGGGKIGDLTIKWDPLKSADQYGPGIYYKVYWRRVGMDPESEFQSLALKEHGNVGMAVVPIQSKYYYTQYEVQVQPANDMGYGPKSEVVVIYSAEDMPQAAPQQVSALSYNGTALNVTWQPIEQTRDRVRGKLIGHRIKYWKEDGREEDAVYYLSRTTRPWSLVVGLEPNTYYYVKVILSWSMTVPCGKKTAIMGILLGVSRWRRPTLWVPVIFFSRVNFPVRFPVKVLNSLIYLFV